MKHVLKLPFLCLMLIIGGCVVLPVDIKNDAPLDLARCESIEHRKELRLVNLNEQDTGYYFSVVGFLLSPILVPTSAIISGSYSLIHNASLSNETIQANEECLSSSLDKPGHAD